MRNFVIILNARKYHTFYEECLGVRQHDVGGLGMYVIFQQYRSSFYMINLGYFILNTHPVFYFHYVGM
jgi:hypothetical protein